ncbi:MAG: hypothetical protein JXP73_12855 [Deltaproteobacteria bacterium]|nr:hypothetical protein [Deltaproteobacteria bacterium]
MSDTERIHSFLRRARSRALVEIGVRTGAYALAVLIVAFCGLALAALLAGPAASWPFVALGTIAACVAGGVALGFVRPSRMFADPAALARMVGRRHPPLASDLLSAVELEAARSGEVEASPDLTRAFCATVAEATGPLAVEDLIPLDRAVRAVLAAAAVFLVMMLAVLAFPTALGRGLRTLFHTPTLFEGARVAREPLVGDVRVTYDYPAYTGLPRRIIEGSTGELRAVRGTRVHLEMRPLRSARQARLLLGDGGEGGTLVASLDRGRLRAGLALSEDGSYRVWLQPFFGRPLREERGHRIVVESDQPPEVDITGPADRLELAAPRPVEVAFHARDDFGLGEVVLVYRVSGGPEQRLLLKDAQGARQVRGTTMFEPVSAMLTPGAQVAYHIEAKDRDEISGSKAGTSRTLYLVIANPRGDFEAQLVREHEMLERLLASLADRIEIEHRDGATTAPERLARLREVHEAEQSHLGDLERLLEQQGRAGGMSKVQASPLAAAVTRLGRLLRDEGEMLKGSAGKSDSVASALAARLRATAPRHTAELENAVLALDDLIGRQRLDDLAAIGKDLVAAHQRLEDLLARYKATGDEQLRRQIEREVRELRARIGELARKIAEVKGRNEVSPEWMNLPDPQRAMESAARLDGLLAKGDARSLGDALTELGDSLASLRDMLDKNAAAFGGARFPHESRALAELSRKLSDLEGDQRGLAQDSRALAKEIDGELGRRLEAQEAEFLAKARQKLEQLRRKLAGGPPRELGSLAETAAEAARDNVQQLLRLLPAEEWQEAQGEAERLADGLGRLRRIVDRQRALRRLSSPVIESYEGQVDAAAALARELAADLGRVIPRTGDVMSAEQRSRGRNLGQRQGGIAERTRGLAHDLGSRGEATPGGEHSAAELEGIAGQMRQAGQNLQEGAVHEGAGGARAVAERLAELRRSLGQKLHLGSRPSREPVRIPDADAYRAPREWRQELMEAMREKAPEKFRDEVRRYYEALVR